MRHSTGCQDDHMALIITDTFKEQDNDTIASLCTYNNSAVVKQPHNLTHKCQPLNITVNKPAKCFIKEKYNKWFAEQVVNQLKKGKNPADVNITLKLSEVRRLRTKYTEQIFEHLKTLKDLIFNGFESVGITEAEEKYNEISNLEENSLRAL